MTGWWFLAWSACAPLLGDGLASVSPFELGYASRFWSVEDGLPGNRIKVITQGPDGYLWVGTGEGLARFDGIRFTAPDGPLPETEVADLLHDAAGRLWIAYDGPFVACLDGGTTTVLGRADGIRDGWKRIAEASDGAICVATHLLGDGDGGLYIGWIRNGRYADALLERRVAGPVLALERGDDREIWGSISRAFGIREDGGPWIDPIAPGSDDQVGDLFRRRDGRLAMLRRSGIWSLSDDEWVATEPARGFLLPMNLRDAAEDTQGNVWLGSYADSLLVWSEGRGFRRVVPARHRFDRNCWAVFVDREGSVWVGTGLGLFQFVRRPFLPWPATERFGTAVVNSLTAGRDGTVWAAGDNQLYSWSVRDGFRADASPNPADEFELVAPARDGGVWVACTVFPLWKFDGVRLHTVLASGNAFRKGALSGMVDTDEGVLWMLTGETLFGLRHGEAVPFAADVADDVTCIAADGSGSLYAASRSGGLLHRRAEGWHPVAPPIPPGQVVRRMALRAGGGVWMILGPPADDGSRWRLGFGDEGCFVSGPIEWLERDVQFASDAAGALWFHGRRGPVRRVSARDAEAMVAAGAVPTTVPTRAFGIEDGIVSTRARELPGTLLGTPDGRMWIASELGVSVHPGEDDGGGSGSGGDPSASMAHPVVIERTRVDQQAVAAEDGRITLAPGSKTLDITFRALGFADPGSLRYRYRLDGYDAGWSEAVAHGQAIYRNLPPGVYRFNVLTATRVSGDDPLVWNPDGASLAVTVEPAWHQRASTRAGAVLIAALGMALGLLARERAVRERSRQREQFARELIASQEDQRRRVAGELHDSLGQELLVIKSRIDIGGFAPRDLSAAVGSAIQQVKQISRELRPVLLERVGLAIALEAMVADVADATRIPIAKEIDPAVDRLLSEEARIGAYRFVQEALNNVVAHSDASEVVVAAAPCAEGVELRVEDDGRGFAPAGIDSRAGRGIGLRGMEERISLLGGRFRCESQPGGGTRLRVTLPASRT